MTGDTEDRRKTVRVLWRRNGLIWAALMALLAATLVFAYIPLGHLTTAIGIGIALLKATLVALLFMELKNARALIVLAALSGLVFATALFTLTLSDVVSRPDPGPTTMSGG